MSFLPGQNTKLWKQIQAKAEDVIGDFKTVYGGDEDFLRYLYEEFQKYESEFSKGFALKGDKTGVKALRALEVQCVELSNALDNVITDTGFMSDDDEDFEEIKEISSAIDRLRKILKSHVDILSVGGRDFNSVNCYWCAALLPYLAFLGKRADRYAWLGRWLLVVAGYKKGVSSLEGWWKKAKHSMNEEVQALPKDFKVTLKEKSSLLSGRLAFLAAFDYLSWRRKQLGKDLTIRDEFAHSEEYRRYMQIVHKQMPFLKILC